MERPTTEWVSSMMGQQHCTQRVSYLRNARHNHTHLAADASEANKTAPCTWSCSSPAAFPFHASRDRSVPTGTLASMISFGRRADGLGARGNFSPVPELGGENAEAGSLRGTLGPLRGGCIDMVCGAGGLGRSFMICYRGRDDSLADFVKDS